MDQFSLHMSPNPVCHEQIWQAPLKNLKRQRDLQLAPLRWEGWYVWRNVQNYVRLHISKPKFWWSANSCYIFLLSSSIIWSFLCRSGGAPIRRLPAQGTPIGRPSGQIHSNEGNIDPYLFYEATIWEMWPIFAAHRPKPSVSCSA